jgi:hypothetical protein
VGAVNWFQGIGDTVSGELCADGRGDARNEIKVVVVAEGVGLDAPDGLLPKARGQRIFAEKKFVGAIHVFDARPDAVAGAETGGGFQQITVKDCVVRERPRAAPENGAGPVAVVQRTVLHEGSGHALLIFLWEERLRTDDARIGVLAAPVLSGLNGEARGP